ncbi:MAG: DUF4384 domain-containing protein [Desulfobacteraceae bacterium]|nr:DUF4384 domain-containing protein [Desulfobacteraceae bacterium]
MKRILFCAVLGLLFLVRPAVFAADTRPGGQPAIPDVDFRWAFAVLSSQDGKHTVSPVTSDLTLKSGDQLKMMVELQRRCYVYLFHYNPREGLQLLFPYTFQQFSADYQPNRRYYVPRGESWFKLDSNPGQEVFYLVSSAERLKELESAYMKHETAAAPQKAETAKAVLDQIRTLRREHRELATPAERPVPIGGALRGVQRVDDAARFDIAAFSDEVLSTGFVARTYTIEHR